MFTIRQAQLEALARDAERRARLDCVASLRAQGFGAQYSPEKGQVEIEDAAGGRATMEFREGAISLTSGEKGPNGEDSTHLFQYDSEKRLKSVTDPAGLRIVFDYDERKRLSAIHRGTFGRYTFHYDADDNLAGIRYPDSTFTRMARDESGRVLELIDRNGFSRRFEYSPHGPPSRVVDAKGNETTYEFNEEGDVSAVVLSNGDRQTYESDAKGRTTVYWNDRRLFTIAVDPDTTSQKYAYADGTQTQFTSDGRRIVAASNDHCSVKLTYDSQGLIASEEVNGRTVRYERDALGILVALVDPDGERIEFERDTEHRLRRVRDGKDQIFDIDYELSGALAAIRYPNGVAVARTCTAMGYPESLTVASPTAANPLLEIGWTYDLCDRVATESGPRGLRNSFRYDREGRLLEVVSNSPASRESYSLDANGNRIKDHGFECEVNTLDQITQRGSSSFEYDPLGNMTSGPGPLGPLRCRYNGRGQLIEAETAAGVTRYAYDPFGRRIRKEQPGRTTHYTWAGDLLLSEVTAEGSRRTSRRYTQVPDLGIALAQRVDGQYHYLHHGRRFEVLAMSDSQGDLVWQARYSAFGDAHIESEHVTQPFRLLGQYYDPETGLHYNVARYYHPQLGRFLQRDPLGAEGGSWNEYIYGGGDPLNRGDPTGEILPILLAGAGIGAVIGTGVEMYRQHKENPGKDFDWGKIGKEALIGGAVGLIGAGVGVALAPALGALGGGLAAAVAGGALAGGAVAAVETCADAAIRGTPVTSAQLMHSALVGATIGGVTGGVGGLLARRAQRLAAAAETADQRLAAGGRQTGAGVESETSCSVGCPVDAITGNVIESLIDFVLPGAFDLTLRRCYSSGLKRAAGFGPGWASNWTQSIDANDDTATFHGHDGRWATFDLKNGDKDGWVSNPELARTYLRRSDTGFEVRGADRCVTRFATRRANRWLLTEIENPNGYVIRFRYGADGGLSRVEHSGGYMLLVQASPDRIERIGLNVDDQLAELVSYRFDMHGRLTEVIDRTGVPFRYEYDGAGRMTRWEDRNKNWNAYRYDGQGRCVWTGGRDGIYDFSLEYDDEEHTTTATSVAGVVRKFIYNELQQPILEWDGRGFVTHTTWDRQSNKLEQRDEAGRGFRQEFDADGNLTAFRDALGRTTHIDYNDLGLPRTLTDAAGYVWARLYDQRGNLIEAKGPDGAVWRYERDDRGNVRRVIDPSGAARQFGYDSRGQLSWSIDAKGNRATMAHDAFGRVIERVDPLGRRTGFSYNPTGKLSEVALPDGNRLRWEYDAEGNMTRRIGADGKAYTYRYGPFDLLQEIVKPSGGKLKLSYDAEARLTAVENELGRVWRYEYNATGQVIREEDFHGRVQFFDYDASGLCIRRMNGLGEEILLDRDAAGQLVSQRAAKETRFEYDLLGRVVRAFKDGSDVAIERDAYGRVLQEAQNGRTVKSSYDSRGLRVTRSTPEQECEWRWDANGQVAGLKLAEDELLEFAYDSAGREVERRTRGGVVLRQEYDALDRLTKQWVGMDPEAGSSRAPIVERQFRYDANGDPVSIWDARWGTSRFAYDVDGRIARAEQDRGRNEEFTYDPAGDISTAREQPVGLLPGRPQNAIKLIKRHYSKDGRLERLGDTRYEWDADGRLKQKREGNRRWRYEWTPEGQLRGVEDPDGMRWDYQYDAFGRRIAKSGNGGTTKYVWDGAVIVQELRERASTVAWIHEPGSFKPLFKQQGSTGYQCVTDQVGTPRELLTANGTLAWSTLPTVWAELQESAASKTDCNVRFQGQWFDAESGLHYNYHRYYDPEIGQYLSPDPIGLDGGTRTYGYAHNPLAWVDPLGLAGCPYQGVRDASKYLHDMGVSRADRVRILQSFEPQNMLVRQAGPSEYGLRYFSKSASPGGSYLFETFPASRESLALGKWNTMSGFRQFQIRPGATVLEGTAAPQGPYLPGGQTQKFILDWQADLIEP